MSVSIVVPARNEEQQIGPTLRAIGDAFADGPYDLEVIVVNDGSSDHTAIEARRAGVDVTLVDLATSHGKGAAIAAGFAVSRGDVVGFIDADLEYPPALLPGMVDLVSAAQGRACAIGVRMQDRRSALERVTSRIARVLAERVLRLRVTDTQAGIKVFPGPFARLMLACSHEHGWLFDVDALLTAWRVGVSIIEVPVVQRPARRRRAGIWAMIGCLPAFVRLAVRRRVPVLGEGESARILRFLAVGLTNTAIDTAAFITLLAVHPTGHNGWLGGLYAGGAWAIASVVGYHLHSSVTFRARLPIAGFYCVTLLGIVVQSGAVALATTFWSTPGAVAGKLCGIALSAMVTYTGYRYLAHKSPVINATADGTRASLSSPSKP